MRYLNWEIFSKTFSTSLLSECHAHSCVRMRAHPCIRACIHACACTHLCVRSCVRVSVCGCIRTSTPRDAGANLAFPLNRVNGVPQNVACMHLCHRWGGVHPRFSSYKQLAHTQVNSRCYAECCIHSFLPQMGRGYTRHSPLMDSSPTHILYSLGHYPRTSKFQQIPGKRRLNVDKGE